MRPDVGQGLAVYSAEGFPGWNQGTGHTELLPADSEEETASTLLLTCWQNLVPRGCLKAKVLIFLLAFR